MLKWHWRTFEALTTDELYEILKARQAVFGLEQNCLYQDIDDLDRFAWHLFAELAEDEPPRQIQAYLRVVHPGRKYDEPSIGRVLTATQSRGKGVGKLLMDKGIAHVKEAFPDQPIRISAQQYLETFYSGFDFKAVSAPYLEDGIPHIEMLRTV